MFNNYLQKNDKFILLKSKLTDFFYSPFFLMLSCILALASYVLQFPYVTLGLFCAFACWLLLTGTDILPTAPMLFLALMQIRNVPDMGTTTAVIMFSCVAVCLVLHYFLYPPKKFFSLALTIPFILVSIAYFLGGLFSPYYLDIKRNILFNSTNGPVLFCIYFIYSTCVNPPKNIDLKKYFSLVLTLVGVVITAQLFINKYYFSVRYPDLFIYTIIGIANVNGAGAILMLSIFSSFYLLATTDHLFKNLFSILVFFVGLYVAESYACLGACTILAPIACVFAVKFQSIKNKKLLINVFCAGILFITVALLLIFVKYGFNYCVQEFLSKISNDHRRTPLFIEAVDLFVKYSIFGVSTAYAPPDSTTEVLIAYNFHSVIFHTLATLGIFGTIAYAIFYIARFKVIMKFNDAYNVFSYFAFVAYFAQSCIDTNENTVVPCMIFIVVFLAIIELANKNFIQTLPLKNKTHFKE